MQRSLAFAVRYATGTVIVALIVVYVIFSIHGSRNLGVIFFNENDPQWANIFVRAQGNLSPEESYSLVTEVEDELNQVVGTMEHQHDLHCGTGTSRRNSC